DIPRADIAELARKSISVMSSHLGYLLDSEPGKMSQLYDELRGFVLEHGIRPVVNSIFDLEEAPQAHEYIESRQSSGKVLLKIGR
ncbi:MAG: zinc-binding dehydrogenase, partial [Thermodesulfobacteriota bacterium]